MDIVETLNLVINLSLIPPWILLELAALSRMLPGLVRDCLFAILLDGLAVAIALVQLTLILVTISLIKSLRPRYKFYQYNPTQVSRHSTNTLDLGRESDDRNTDGADKSSVFLLKPIGWLLSYFIDSHSDQYAKLCGECRYSLDDDGIRTTHDRLPWSKTLAGVEGVSWINQALRTLWPSIKTLLFKYLLFDILRPTQKSKFVRKQRSGSQRPKVKLSVYLSVRRKLEQLRRSQNADLRRSVMYFDRRIITSIAYGFRFFIIYLKQFVVDQLSLFSNTSKESRLNKMNPSISSEQKALRAIASEITRRAAVKLNSRCIRLRRKSASAPTRFSSNKTIVSDFRPTASFRGRLRPRGKCSKMLEVLDKAILRRTRPGFTVERIRLGNGVPMITGIKLVEDTCRSIGEQEDRLTEDTSKGIDSSSRSMSFMSEIYYENDENFQIRMNLPFLESIELNHLAVQLRLMLTVNHSIDKQDLNLDILKTSCDNPIINYVQISLVDVLKLDWTIVNRANKPKSCESTIDVYQTKSSKSSLLGSLQGTDLIRIINHPYFKYLVQSIIHLVLRWFRPFDIKVGDKLHLRTMR